MTTRHHRNGTAAALLATLALLGGGACERTPLASGEGAEPDCQVCHGNADNAAPPRAVDGSEDTTVLAVGAHQAHLLGSAQHAPVPCDSCHRVPTEVGDDGHLGRAPAELVFSDLADGDDLQPSYDPTTGRCASVYCHGASLHGGQHTTPVWNRVDGKQATCWGCHGAPPPPPHPQLANCWLCHDETVADDGNILVADGKHLDGELQARRECWDCHGSEPSGAPPAALDGSSATTHHGVGAHTAHVAGASFSAGVPCASCHRVPVALDDRGHIDGDGHAEVIWGPIARADGASPSYSHSTDPLACSNVYCHGATLAGGTTPTPVWTEVGSGQIVCGSCHGLPPPAPHVQQTACEVCHPDTAISSSQIRLASGTHVNGQVDVPQACNGCHGDADSAAPPRALDGSTELSALGVGAHRSHLRNGPVRAALDCADCHRVPLRRDDPGHLDDGPAELVFGELARAQGSQPVWDRDADPPSCAATYCHGSTLSGGQFNTPSWTTVDGSQSACDACHGFPPPPPHTQQNRCETCHPRTVLQGQIINLSSGVHIDGEVSFY